MELTENQIARITASISPARVGTYVSAALNSESATALQLYQWNAQVSSAFFSALHICEVVTRNAVAQALELKYGAAWPWNPGFERTIPDRMKAHLRKVRQKAPAGATGQVISELKLSFWCGLLTKAQDQHLWNSHIRRVFPGLPYPLNVAAARAKIHADLELIRAFRNRIAHHEPVLGQPLTQLHGRITHLITLRCPATASWLRRWDTVPETLALRPK